MSSLRDQLLKKGVVTKKQAKKARIEARLDKKKGHDDTQKIQQVIQAQKDVEKLRVQELNRRLEEEKKAREQLARAVDIAHSQNILDRPGPIFYYFAVDKSIKHIQVTNQQRELLARGYAAIIYLGGDCYSLLHAEALTKVVELNPSLVVCRHSWIPPDQEVEDDSKALGEISETP
ncbi:MAG: DUF2058 family protein [Oligoflexales bacterium]